jgi:hypothetical protein
MSGLINDWRFNIAYNAALPFANITDYELAGTISDLVGGTAPPRVSRLLPGSPRNTQA